MVSESTSCQRGPSPPPDSEDEDSGEDKVIKESQMAPPEEDEGDDKATQASTCASARKKRKPNVVIDEATNKDIIEWLRDNPLLYSKGMKDYKDTQKERIWSRKADDLKMDVSQLKTWYKSLQADQAQVWAWNQGCH